MSSASTSHSHERWSPRYEPTGYAAIEVSAGSDGVTLTANADGLRSLSRLFAEMAEAVVSDGHIHLTPSMQLSPGSAALAVARREMGALPDGSASPEPAP